MSKQVYQEAQILQFFSYGHLPLKLRNISQPFSDLAHTMARILPPNAETSTMLRKILEAKDCAVRSAILADTIELIVDPNKLVKDDR